MPRVAAAPGWPAAAPRGFVRQVERVRIDRIAAGGDGVGRLADGRAVFVPRAAPGDLAAVVITKAAPRFARASLREVIEPGPDRVEPACPHYDRDRCGGCQLQHLSPAGQVAARRAIVGDAVRRIAKLPLADDPALAPAPDQWGYRAKISLTRGSGGIGFHRYDRLEVFDLVDCRLAAAPLRELWHRVAGRRRDLPATLERVVLRLDRAGGRHLVLEVGAGPVWAGGKALFAALGEGGLTVWLRPEGGAARAVAGADSAYPATAFEQVNPAMGDRVRARALAALGPVADKRVWDLYAGIGESSAALAEAGAQVESVEWDRGAVAAAEAAQQGHGRRIERVAGAVEEVVGSLGRPDLVLTNPPRTGMDPRVVAAVRERGPERVVYVSCDPATLARDLARLTSTGTGASYRMADLEAFDLFPQTAHVESVALLERQ